MALDHFWWGPSLDLLPDSCNGALWLEHCWVIVIGMHYRFTVSDEINIICTVPYTEELKNQLTIDC